MGPKIAVKKSTVFSRVSSFNFHGVLVNKMAGIWQNGRNMTKWQKCDKWQKYDKMTEI